MAVLLVAAVMSAGAAEAQNTKMPSTLRWGSGYLDAPSASVLPHLAIAGTYSGFWVNLDNRLLVGPQGQVIGSGDELDKYYSDGSIYFGLFDRLELGGVIHSFDDEGTGNIVGGFARLALLRPETQGLGLAVGTRYLTEPDFNDNVVQQPNRLGIPDQRFLQNYGGGPGALDDVNTQWSHYAVTSLFLRGLSTDWLPENDFTFTVGWGNGLFNDGEDLNWYSFADSEGWFTGAVSHIALSETSLLNLMGEWNGFDINLGAQLDLGGLRLGAHYLG
ncbi:MAG: hypothetical protein KY453_05565, partial [Gemmatimonadetes bacterium]|nr:hypothetical protein [Gemmatimonadota bacterium]